MLARVPLAVLVAAALVAPATAGAQDAPCLTTDPPPVRTPAQPLRFGITPAAAGSVGAVQGAAAPENAAEALRALGDLRPPRRELVLRLNRLFWADGDAGIRAFADRVDAYARAGLTSEIQVRYHPPAGREGDIGAWEAFVRAAVRELGRRPAVVAFSITNEANFPGSENTSDGAYDGVVDALVRGVAAAGEELAALGRPDVDVGFSMMWRWSPPSDAAFWRSIGERATPAFRRALDYVGLQVYPGLVWPPVPLPGRDAGDEIAEALTLLRTCYLPKAALGRDVDLWVSENGYATNLGRDQASQAASLRATVDAVRGLSGELGISDFRYFNLRDNDSDGTDLFAAVGLLRDDYARKPAFGVLRSLVAAYGEDVAAPTRPASAPRRSARLTVRVRRRDGRVVARGRLRARPCHGAIRLRAGARTRRVAVRRDCSFAVAVRAPRRRALVTVRYEGSAALRPATVRRRV